MLTIPSVHLALPLRGFFRVGSTVHLIEPLDADEEGQHAMYQAKHLQQKAGTCGVKDTNLNDLGPRALEIYRAQPRVSNIIPCWSVQSQTPCLGIGMALCSPEASPVPSGWARESLLHWRCLDFASQHRVGLWGRLGSRP